MDDLSSDITPASTVLDDAASPSASGAGTPRTLDEPQSLRDSITASIKEQSDALEKDDASKADPEPKAEPDKPAEETDKKQEAAKEEKPKEDDPKADKARDERGKSAAKEPEPKAEPEKTEIKDGKPRHPEPPQRFLPRAKELWPNVPNEVKGEVARMATEHENEVRQAREFIAPLVKYHQMAQESGTTVHEALERYVGMEQTLRHNPTEGFKALLANMGLQPQQAISHILKAFNVPPQALAQHIAQDASAYVTRDVPQQPKEDPRISHLQQQLEQERASRVRAEVIEPFKANHERYDELEGDIAFFLSSGKIPANLSHIERLEAAYDMAVRINPASNVEAPQASRGPVAEDSRAVSDLGGTKSIKSAPGSVTPDMEPERGGSIRDILMDEVRRRRVS